MGWRDGRRIAGRVTLRRLGGNHHPPNAGVVFYHLEGKAGKGARYAASEPHMFLKQHCLWFVLPLGNGGSSGLFINAFLKLISAEVIMAVTWLFLATRRATLMAAAGDNYVGRRQNK